MFHDLELMEREGTGFDLMYDRLLSQGRPAPVATEGPDSVSVTSQRRILRSELMRLIAEADGRFQLSQRERITLGVLGQGEGLTARHLADALQVESGSLKSWLGRLAKFELVLTSGRAARCPTTCCANVICQRICCELSNPEPNQPWPSPGSTTRRRSGRVGPWDPRAELRA